MAEPENIILEHLRGIRAQIEQLDRKFEQKFDGLSERVDTLEIKLDGLTHAVIAGFGSVVHELDALKERVGRLESERA